MERGIINTQKAFDLSLKCFLFLSPLFFFKTYYLSWTRGMFFIFGAIVLFFISLLNEPKRHFNNVWLALIGLTAFARIFIDNNLKLSNFWFSANGFMYVFAGILLFWTVYCHAEALKSYLLPIVYINILNCILSIAQFFGQDFLWQSTPSLSGFMETSSQLGQYSAMSLPLLISIHPILAIFPVINLFLAKSISPILATFTGIAFFCIVRPLKWPFMIGLGIIGVILFALNFDYIMTKFQCRPMIWQKTLKMSLQRPYAGWGYGSWTEKVLQQEAITSLGVVEFNRPHNDYLHNPQELGWPIIIFVGGFFFGLWRKFKAKINKDMLTYILATSVVIVLVNMAGQSLIRYASVGTTFIILLAFLTIKIDEEVSNAHFFTS